ncbi:MAG TPA: SDR family oxidoreductase [Thermoanaerobaculia bacterium]|nr:SDR family oxidoreductase [Thermoanaerobaculia bacterium]
MPKRRKILLTGASGVLGQAVLQRLAREGPVVCLCHHTPVAAAPGIELLSGDLAAPHLGLGARELAALTAEIGGVLHLGAATNFAATAEELARTNVDGTRCMVELARAAEVPLWYVSTAFAHLQTEGETAAREERKGTSAGGHEDYEDSKREAEAVVREGGVPYLILRPSLVAGDAGTGFMPAFQGLHTVIFLLFHNLLPILPAAADSRVDFLPRDLVADLIVGLTKGAADGRELWLTAGDEALTVAALFALGIDYARGVLAREAVMPRLVSQDMFDRLIRPVFLPALPVRMRRGCEQLLPLIKYLNLTRPFPTSLPEIAQQMGVGGLDLKAVFERNLSYVATRCRLAPAAGASAAVAAGDGGVLQ